MGAVDGRALIVKVELAFGRLTHQFARAVTDELMNSSGDEPHDMSAMLEELLLQRVNIVAGVGGVMVCIHSVGNDHILRATGLSDIVVL
jgi:hypothetical protein